MRAPLSVGVNAMDRVQERPGARDAVQLFVETAKSPVRVGVMAPLSCLLVTLLVTVQTRAGEVWPMTVSAKAVCGQDRLRPGLSRAVPIAVRAGDDTFPSETAKVAEALPAIVGLKVTTIWQVAAGSRAAWQVVV